MPEQPIDHIARPALPWRNPDRTECGRLLTDVASVVDRSVIEAKIKRHGQQRAAFTTCMTCAQTSDRYRTWEVDPVEVMLRELDRSRAWKWNPDPSDGTVRTVHELRAIAALIDAHRDEFDAYVDGLETATDLTQRRSAKRTRRA